MKFKIKKDFFNKHLAKVLRSVSARNSLPILSGIEIIVEENSVFLIGSNSDTSIKEELKIDNENKTLKIFKTGKIVVNARFFSEIIKKLPEEFIDIEVNDKLIAKITSGASEFEINGLPANQFPELPNLEKDNVINLDSQSLIDLINETAVAISNQEIRPILTGIHFEIENSILSATATDSHRLSKRTLNLNDGNSHNYDIIIPGKSFIELTRIIDDDIDKIKMFISSNQVLFSFKETNFYTRLLEGTYPDTSRLISEESNTKLEMRADELLSVIERISILSHASRSNIVKLSINASSSLAILSGSSEELGKSEEKLPVKNVSGSDIDISFNPDYLRDALKSLYDSEITISFVSELRPFTVLPTKKRENQTFIQLITPIRTS